MHRWTTAGVHRARSIGSARKEVGLAILIGVGITLGGCQPVQTGFDSPAPTKRIDAIVAASDLDDPDSLGKLIEQLQSPDPAARMLAIGALQSRTGETFGYEHAAPRWERIESINQWVEYLDEYESSYWAAKQEPNGESATD